MAQKTVRLPNGETATVNVPDDATDEQVLRFVKREYEAGSFKKPEPDPVKDMQDLPLSDKVIGTADYAYNSLRHVAADLAGNIAKVAQAGADAAGLYDRMGIDSKTVLDSVKTLENFVAGKPFTDAGQKVKEGIEASMAETLEGTLAQDALLYMDDKVNEFKGYLTDLTGSEIVADGLLAAPEIALDIAIPALAPVRGTKATGKVALKDIRKAALNMAIDANKIREVRSAAYDSVKPKPLRRGTVGKVADRMREVLQNNAVNLEMSGMGGLIKGLQDNVEKELINRTARLQTGRANETLNDLIEMQKSLYSGYKQADPATQRAITIAAQEIDRFMLDGLDDAIPPFAKRDLNTDQVRKQLEVGKTLSGQLIRAGQIDEVMRSASFEKDPIKAMENGLRAIMKDPKKAKFYSPQEQALFKEITTGRPLKNESADSGAVVRLLGKVGTGASFMSGGRFVTKLARAYRAKRAFQGRPIQGAVVAPARFIDDLLGAKNRDIKAYENLSRQVLLGEDGVEAIKRYLKAVPKAKRNYKELGEILADSNYDLRDIKIDETASRLQREAAEYARGVKVVRAALASTATEQVSSLNAMQEEDENE